MSFTLGQISTEIGATLKGDAGLVITDLASIEAASTGELSFVVSPKYRKEAESSKASALISYPKFESKSKSLLVMDDPYLGFAKAMRLFYRCFPSVTPGIEKTAVIADGVAIPSDTYIGHNVVISKGAKIGKGVIIQAGVFVGENSVVGDNCVIYQNVTIRENIEIGNRVVIYPNAVIGSDGFGYRWDGVTYLKIPQIGTVVIEDNCEIGAGTTIDRATMGKTIIGKNTIIDNQVQIGHNCIIGPGSAICAQVGLAGSTTLEKRVTLAGQVGVAGHLTIGENSFIEAQSGVASDTPPNSIYFGYPAKDIKKAHKIEAIINHLPEYVIRIRKLESLFNKKS